NQKAKTTAAPPQREIKGPDDDENFLWELEKEAFKQRRERERAAEEKRRPQSGNRKDLPDSSDDTDNRDNPDNRNNPRSEDYLAEKISSRIFGERTRYQDSARAPRQRPFP